MSPLNQQNNLTNTEKPKQESLFSFKKTEIVSSGIQRFLNRNEATDNTEQDKFNYFAIYGTTTGALVKADSKLSVELYHVFVQKSANLLREVVVPRDLDQMRGYDGKTTKTATTEEFSFEFGTKGEFSSQLDNAAK